MADGRGGRREGAGRKPQSVTIKRVSPAVLNAGILPLEMRLQVSRQLWSEAVDQDGAIIDMAKAKEAADFAESCLRYTSPSLSSIEHSGPLGGPIEHRMRDAKNDLQSKLARLGAQEAG